MDSSRAEYVRLTAYVIHSTEPTFRMWIINISLTIAEIHKIIETYR